jgi:flavodoxin
MKYSASYGDGNMIKAIIIYDTKFGNTEKIAKSLASGSRGQGIEVDCVNVEDVQIEKLTEYDLLAIGGPTHGFGMSKPIKDFMGKLKHIKLRNKNAFAFDTKNRGRWGSAAKRIEKNLMRIGLNIIKPCDSAIVFGLKGPLQDGMESKFIQIGAELASV